MNWSGKDDVILDMGAFGLTEGQRFRVIDVQNIASDVIRNNVYEGIYTQGRQVEVPMNLTSVVEDPTGEMAGPIHTEKEFGTFLVIALDGFSRPDPDPIPDPEPEPDPVPFDGKINGAVYDPDSKCVQIVTEGNVVQVVITPIGGFGSHTENNPEWTICPWDMERISEQELKGTIIFNVVAIGPNGETVDGQFPIDYGGEEPPDPIDPVPPTTDYVTTDHFDNKISQLEDNNQARHNILFGEIQDLLDLIKELQKQIEELRNKKLILKGTLTEE